MKASVLGSATTSKFAVTQKYIMITDKWNKSVSLNYGDGRGNSRTEAHQTSPESLSSLWKVFYHKKTTDHSERNDIGPPPFSEPKFSLQTLQLP